MIKENSEGYKAEYSEEVLSRFIRLNQKGHLGHAYLLCGAEDSGKGETAIVVAKFINCEQKTELPCGACPSCIKVEKGNHPDVILIDNGWGETIKIEQVREILSQVRLRPFMAEKKVIIIKNIENFTQEGANALLKTLEEPTASSLLILTTTDLDRCLATVKSRCHIIPFLPMAKEKLVRQLKCDYDEGNEKLHFLAYFSEGCLGKARKFKESGLFEQKNSIIDIFIKKGLNAEQFKQNLSDKQKTKELLNIILSWLHDAILLKGGVGQKSLIHQDRLSELESFQKRYSYRELDDLHHQVIEIHHMFNENFNIKISMGIFQTLLKL